MTPSSFCCYTNEVLDGVLALLDQTTIRRTIDEPIDRAAAGFSVPTAECPTLQVSTFLDRLAEFVSHLYREGLLPARILTRSQARIEAVHLLESAYEGRAGRGFESAYVDCLASSSVGLELLLAHLADSLKTHRRATYVRWVLASQVNLLEWRRRRDLVAACLDRFGKFLPAKIRQGPPERFVPQCDRLVLLAAACNNEVQGLLGGFRP